MWLWLQHGVHEARLGLWDRVHQPRQGLGPGHRAQKAGNRLVQAWLRLNYGAYTAGELGVGLGLRNGAGQARLWLWLRLRDRTHQARLSLGSRIHQARLGLELRVKVYQAWLRLVSRVHQARLGLGHRVH